MRRTPRSNDRGHAAINVGGILTVLLILALLVIIL